MREEVWFFQDAWRCEGGQHPRTQSYIRAVGTSAPSDHRARCPRSQLMIMAPMRLLACLNGLNCAILIPSPTHGLSRDAFWGLVPLRACRALELLAAADRAIVRVSLPQTRLTALLGVNISIFILPPQHPKKRRGFLCQIFLPPLLGGL